MVYISKIIVYAFLQFIRISRTLSFVRGVFFGDNFSLVMKSIKLFTVGQHLKFKFNYKKVMEIYSLTVQYIKR